MRQSERVSANHDVMAPPAGRRWGLAFAVTCVTAVAAAVGFVWFVTRVNDLAAVERNASADGVVVLTGGPDRIADAIDLLAAGRGKRLLITGVNPMTRMQELARQQPKYAPVFSCCVDIDHSATNTVGNAIETRRWAQPHNFRSLIVVTSSYHMPRAIAELSHQLPGVTLIPYPVVTERGRTEEWWMHATTARTLAIEYVKYVAAVVRTRLEPNPAGNEIAAVRVGDKN
ncbi:MAG: YdcF family protein [Xanthobacteraceae bacterium]